jgi:tripartite-type tricarboxylate transporter receptor subunit TctC
MKKKSIFFMVLLGLLCGFSLSFAAESSYPTKPIEVIVGYGPGGGTDLGARGIAEDARKYLGQNLIVVNKPGGAGRVAMTLLAKSNPDGYTLGGVTDTSIILTPHLEKVPYKPLEDFTFITQFGVLRNGFVVLKESPFQSFKDLIEFAKANPNKLTVATSGAGTGGYVACTALNKLYGLNIKLVPFAGAAQGTTALLGGHVMAAVSASSGVTPQLKAGRIRLLAMIGPKRVDEFPEVPTLRELGYPMEFETWYLIAGPKNMEKSVVEKLDGAFRKSMESPDFKKLVEDLGIKAKDPLSGDELRKEIVRRSAQNAALLKQLGMGIKE